MTTFPLKRGPLGAAPGVMFGWRITSTFGSRINPLTGRPGNHGGMDLAWAGCTGQPILAPCSGLVSQGWDPTGGGNWTGIVGDNGSYWGLGHASRFAPGVAGRRVPAGAVVAYVGTTGASTGPHLHVGYRAPGSGHYGDPYDQLVTASLADGNPPPENLLPTRPKDWLDMATEEEARRMVAVEVDRALAALISQLADFRDYKLITDGRQGRLSSWVLCGLTKRWVPSTGYGDILAAAAKSGQAVQDLGMRGDGDPWIALLDFAMPVGPLPNLAAPAPA